MATTEIAPANTLTEAEAAQALAAKALGKQWDPTAGLAETMAELRRLGLEEYVLELDEKGYTIVPPEVMGPPGAERMLDAVLRIAEEDSGFRPDIETGSTIHSTIAERSKQGHKFLIPFQDSYDDLLLKDRVFEEALMNPVMLALVTYLLGEHAELSTRPGVWLRGPVGREIPEGFVPPSLHSDNYGVPSPFPPYAQICNATWALTDYSRRGGAHGFIPGSHKLQRHPLTTSEMLDRWVPAECPAGSLIFWHGNTWHTIGNPRTIPGVRVSTAFVFCRPHMLPIKRHTNVPQEMIDRNPPRFARLLGLHNRYVMMDSTAENKVEDEGIPAAPSQWQ